MLGARRVERIKSLADELTSKGGKALAIPTDVTDYEQVKRLVDSAVQTYGRIDVMINEDVAIPAASFAQAVAFAISQPEEVDVNEILFRPTRQEL